MIYHPMIIYNIPGRLFLEPICFGDFAALETPDYTPFREMITRATNTVIMQGFATLQISNRKMSPGVWIGPIFDLFQPKVYRQQPKHT